MKKYEYDLFEARLTLQKIGRVFDVTSEIRYKVSRDPSRLLPGTKGYKLPRTCTVKSFCCSQTPENALFDILKCRST